MNSRFQIPIQWKLILPALLLSIVAGWMGYRALKSAWSQEYEHTLLDFSLKRLRAANHEKEFKIHERFGAIAGLSQTAYRELTLERTTTGMAVFQAAGPVLRKEILDVSFYEGDSFDRAYFSYVNWNLLKTEKLPRDIHEQIQQKYPLTAAQFEDTSELTLLNRSLVNDQGEPLPILSFLFTMETESGTPIRVVADLINEFLSPPDENGLLGEVFWMKRDGTLISHPSISLTQRYSNHSMSHEIRPFLERATASAEHVLVSRDRARFLSSVIPTSYKGIYAVSEIPIESVTTSVTQICWNLGLILCGWVGVLLFIYSIVGGQLVRQMKTLEFNMEIARNLAVHPVSAQVTPVVSQSAETPVVREEPLRLPKVLQVEATTIAFYQPPAIANDKRVIWDVNKVESQLWMFLGTIEGDISAKPDLAQVTKKVLTQTRFSPEGKPTVPLVEQIKKLNDYLFQEFSGKTWIHLTAIQLNLVSGEMKSVTAASEAPYIVTMGPDSGVPKDEHVESAPSVGLRGDTQFKMEETILATKEGFCLFQKTPAFAEQPPLSFRGEIKSLVLRSGMPSVGQLRQAIFTSSAKDKLQQALMLAVVQFQKPAPKTEPAPTPASTPPSQPAAA